MSALAVTVFLPVAPPVCVGRVLASRIAPTRREAAAWLDRNAVTWRGALGPGEQCFIAWAHDRNGVAVLHREYPRDPNGKVIEHGRTSLRAMQAVTTTRTTEGKTK